MWVWSWGERMELKIKISAYCGIYSLAWDGWIRSLGESIDKSHAAQGSGRGMFQYSEAGRKGRKEESNIED